MGDTVSEDFYQKWVSLRRAVSERSIEEVVEEAAYTWFNRLVAIRIMVKNGLIAPVLQYESEGVLIPLLVSEARQGRIPRMDADDERKLNDLLQDDSKTAEQFRILIVAFCHDNPVINGCFGHISDYTELLLPTNIIAEGGFVDMLNNTEFIAEEDYHSPELIGWLYQFYISEKKDDVFASFKKGKKAEAKDIPAATQIFTPNWIVKYMVQNTIGRLYLDNNPYETDIQKGWKYLIEPSEPTPKDCILHINDLKELEFGDLASGSGHILNEGFDILYDLYILEGYSRRDAIENIFKYNLTGVDIDTRAKQLAQFALLIKACQKDSSFADAHIMPRVLDMPHVNESLWEDIHGHFYCAYNITWPSETIHKELLEAFRLLRQANNLGSIMKFDISAETRTFIQLCVDTYTKEPKFQEAFAPIIHGLEIILILTEKYSVLVMNPPYMGSSNMNADLKGYLEKHYLEGKADLMTTFMLKAKTDTCVNGYWAMINLPSWMFLGTFVELRKTMVQSQQIESLLHLGRGIFGSDFGSVAFVMQNHIPYRAGTYRRLFNKHVEVRTVSKIHELYLDKKFGYYIANQNNYLNISGVPLAYWASKKIYSIFSKSPRLGDYMLVKSGLSTGDNNVFLRIWHETDFKKIILNDAKNKIHSNFLKWVPYNKGGGARKWYGLNYLTVNWQNDGEDITNAGTGVFRNRLYYLKEGITFSALTSATVTYRYSPQGYIFDSNKGPMLFCSEESPIDLYYVLGLLNTKINNTFGKIINPTMSTQVSDIEKIAFIQDSTKIECIRNNVKEDIFIARTDWDAHETSWDFDLNELLKMDVDVYMDNINYEIEKHFKETGERIFVDPAAPEQDNIEWCYQQYCTKWERLFMKLHENEEELNRQFIEIYGLQDELTPDVPLDEITILQQGEIKIEDGQLKWNADVVMKQLLSYALGCMMGRYSIDKPGLILANQGDGQNEYNEQVPNSRFEPDDDGIIPLMSANTEFSDNATLRFKQWLSTAFSDEKLVDNLNFIEGALGKSIDDYFVKDFWKDHKKMYQNRPIYWLFSSKKGAFQCLAYMHLMDAYTTERIRTKYLLPHIEWLVQKQSEMEVNAANLSSRERKKLDSITKQIQECREYHDRLHVVADEQIAFDLDDGVEVNYAKFGDVLSKIK
jgi:hypothetical protein